MPGHEVEVVYVGRQSEVGVGAALVGGHHQFAVLDLELNGSILVNSYPTYFEKLPPLLARINTERRPSKNYVLFLKRSTNTVPAGYCLMTSMKCLANMRF